MWRSWSRRRPSARVARATACAVPRSSPSASGTTRRPASVGVDARQSATKSSSGVSTSCPIALITGVRASETTRSSVSLENGSSSSAAPPPRAMTMTSTSGSASSSLTAALTSATAVLPWTATSRIANRTDGQRRRAFSTTSFSAALPRPVTSPTCRGRNGSGRFRSASNSPSCASRCLRISIRASRSPTPTGRICRASSMSVPRLGQNTGLACRTTRAPSSRGEPIAAMACTEIEAASDMSTSGSRRTR